MANVPNSLPNYTPNDSLLNEMETLYSYILDNIGLNQADPIAAAICYFNHSGRIYPDPPKVGRTRIFMTRPNLNLRSPGNIDRCRILSYATANKIGTTVARFLMYPSIVNHISFGGLYCDTEKLNCTWKDTGTMVGTAWDGCVGRIGVRPSSDERSRYNIKMGLYGNMGNSEDVIAQTGYSYHIDETPFIPLVSNLCTDSGSGKDIVLETEQTDPNFSGNHLVYGSGINESKGPGEITLSFEDIYGSPMFYMILLWVYYIHYVAKGICNPEQGYIVNRIIDYTCSIYIFMLDTDQKTIVRATKYTGCFPKSIPFGNIMHSKEIDFQSLAKISVPFQYNFCSAMDPLIFREFNMIAECALTNRPGSGGYNSDYDIDESRKDEIISSSKFFYGKNHNLSLKDALYFRNTWLPTSVPLKLLNPQIAIGRATDIEPYNSYTGMDANKLFGDTSDIDQGKNLNLGGHQAFEHYQIGDYRGYLGDVINYRTPYIVDGNKLMYL